MKARMLNHIRSNVVGYLALFLILTSGTAYALDGRNTVFSDDIVNGEVKTADIGNGQVRSTDVADDTTGFALTGADVANGSLTGLDVKESTLGQVPSALLGGLGRSTGGDNRCDPDSYTLVTCVTVELTLPAQARVLVIGRVTPKEDDYQFSGAGLCDLGTDWTGPLDGSEVDIFVYDEYGNFPHIPLVAVTPLVGPGLVSFGIDCSGFGIHYDYAQITAVALSAS